MLRSLRQKGKDSKGKQMINKARFQIRYEEVLLVHCLLVIFLSPLGHQSAVCTLACLPNIFISVFPICRTKV